MSYDKLSDNEKKKIITDLYSVKKKSFKDIAELYSTYANKIRRDAIKFKINIRDKSDAQKNALQTGKHKHPTKGTTRTEDTKNKIGASVMNFWDNMDDTALEHRKLVAKNNWDNMSEDKKIQIQKSANIAVREASKEGSKLEKFLLDKLLGDGYRTDFHKEQSLLNTKLQIDLFLPELNVAIEVDGPSHFLPVWGDDTLNKNIKYDNKKTGLILGKGLVLIRIKQTREFSKARGVATYSKLKTAIEQISKKFPEPDNRIIEIGD